MLVWQVASEKAGKQCKINGPKRDGAKINNCTFKHTHTHTIVLVWTGGRSRTHTIKAERYSPKPAILPNSQFSSPLFSAVLTTKMYVPHSSAACLAALRFCHFCVCFHFRSHFVSLLFLRFVLVCLLFLVELSRRLIFSIFYLSSSPSRFLQSFNERGGGRVSPSLTDCYHSDIRLCLCLFTRACLSSSNCSLAPSRSVATLSVSLRESLAFVIVSLFRWRRPSPPTYPTLLLLQTLQESCKQTHEQTQRNKESGEVEQKHVDLYCTHCRVVVIASTSSSTISFGFSVSFFRLLRPLSFCYLLLSTRDSLKKYAKTERQ